MTFRPADVLQPEQLDEAFAGADVVVHLAFTVLDRGMHPEQVRLVNVEGSANVFAAAAAAGVKRVVYASSIAAYGAWPDNPVPDPRVAPHPRATPASTTPSTRPRSSRCSTPSTANHPDIEVVRIRPCVVVGPNSVDLFRGPVPTPLVGHLPVAPAAQGPAGPGRRADAVRSRGRRRRGVRAGDHPARRLGRLQPGRRRRDGGRRTWPRPSAPCGCRCPAGLARRLVDVAYRARISPTGSAWIDMAAYPVVVDTTRARTELGWVPRYDTPHGARRHARPLPRAPAHSRACGPKPAWAR